MLGLPDGEKILRICGTIDTIQACDRQTDRQTDKTSCDGIVRAMHTRRVVKTGPVLHYQITPTSLFSYG